MTEVESVDELKRKLRQREDHIIALETKLKAYEEVIQAVQQKDNEAAGMEDDLGNYSPPRTKSGRLTEGLDAAFQRYEERMGENVTLDFTDDSPMFRRQLEGLEDSLSSLKLFLTSVLTAVNDFVKAGKKFSSSLFQLGAELTSRKHCRSLYSSSYRLLGELSDTLQLLGDFSIHLGHMGEALSADIETVFAAPLQNFTDKELVDISELRKRLESLGDDYEQALSRSLLRKNRTPKSDQSISSLSQEERKRSSSTPMEPPKRKSSPSRSSFFKFRDSPSEQLTEARRKFELARFDLVCYLNQIDAKKKFCLVDCVNSGLKIQSLQSPLVQKHALLAKAKTSYEKEERMWKRKRETLELVLSSEEEEIQTFTVPVEVLSKSTLLLRRAEALEATYRRSGYLYLKQQHQLFQQQWKRIWVTVHNGKLYHIKSAKDLDPVLLCDLMLCNVRELQQELPYCFEIVDNNSSRFVFQAASQYEMSSWVSCLQQVIELMIGGHGESETLNFERGLVAGIMSKSPSCADCGTSPSEWVSINLGLTLCIDCSGIHRGFGVHVSKVRSLKLDRMEISTLRLLQSLGNELVNGQLLSHIPDDLIEKRPSPTSDRSLREEWANLKYVERRFISPTTITEEELKDRFLEAAQHGDLSELLWCILHNVKVDAADSLGNSALHKCVENAYVECCELLIQHGASLLQANQEGLTPVALAEELKLPQLIEMMTIRML